MNGVILWIYLLGSLIIIRAFAKFRVYYSPLYINNNKFKNIGKFFADCSNSS